MKEVVGHELVAVVLYVVDDAVHWVYADDGEQVVFVE